MGTRVESGMERERGKQRSRVLDISFAKNYKKEIWKKVPVFPLPDALPTKVRFYMLV